MPGGGALCRGVGPSPCRRGGRSASLVRLHRCAVISGAKVGTSRAMSSCRRAAGTTRHKVVDVLVTGVAPFRRCAGGIGVGACQQLDGAFDTLDQYQARTIRGAIRHGRFCSASDGRRHVVEQAGKEAQCATSPGLHLLPDVPVKKNRGNGGTGGTPSVSGPSRGGTCTPPKIVGNSDNHMSGIARSLIFKNMFVFPLFPNTSIRGNGYRPRFYWPFPRSPCSPR